MYAILFFGILVGLIFVDPSNPQQIARTRFSCNGRSSGYYADTTTGCQVYHMCDGLGRQFSYTCPNATLFQQRMLICDHWYMVNCSKSEEDYNANLLIGQKRPFVEDSESHPYSRTPRPDLLTHISKDSKHSSNNRNDRIKEPGPSNIVGAETDELASTDQPTYFPPSHWSTEYFRQSTTQSPLKTFDNQQFNTENIFKTNYPSIKKSSGNESKGTKGKAIDLNSSNKIGNNFQEYLFKSRPDFRNKRPYGTAIPPVKFQSSFRATTPVFPLARDEFNKMHNAADIFPPIPYNFKLNSSLGLEPNRNLQKKGNSLVNFPSDFKATTPVYPAFVNPEQQEYNQEFLQAPTQEKADEVNFSSNFQATTTVYPTSVDVKDDIVESDLLLPNSKSKNSDDISYVNISGLRLSLEPPEFESSQNLMHNTMESAPPSKFYQPPKYEPDFTLKEPVIQQNNLGIKLSNFMKSFNRTQWKDLMKVFHIPDYEFPLDNTTRPSYDSVLDSFEVNAKKITR